METVFSFTDLRHQLINATTSLGYQQPSAVQQKAMPIILTGKYLLVIAQTGTGKIAVYTLPLLERLKHQSNHSVSPERHLLRLLILTPTCKLAEQIGASLTKFLYHLSLKHAVICGGTPITLQIDLLHQGVEIVVTTITIGRLLIDILKQSALKLNKVEMVMLDEADKILDIGFFNDISKLFAQLTKKRQILLFSTIFPTAIEQLAQSFLHHVTRVEIASNNSTNISVEQYISAVDDLQKNSLFYDILRKLKTQSLDSCNIKLKADCIAHFSCKQKLSTVAIHSDKMQQIHVATLQKFKDAKIHILVSIDIAVHGLNITALPTVIYNLAQQTEDYIQHRTGRTGSRADLNDLAISLVDEKAEKRYRSIIMQLTQQQLPLTIISHYESKWLSSACQKHALVNQIKTAEQLNNRSQSPWQRQLICI